MKNVKFILISVILATAMFSFYACESGSEKTATEQQGKEYSSAYICPMHCAGSGSDVAGKCPVCEMDYAANKDHKANGHSH